MLRPVKDWAQKMAVEIDAHDEGGLEILPVIESLLNRFRGEVLDEAADVAELGRSQGANTEFDRGWTWRSIEAARVIRVLKEKP